VYVVYFSKKSRGPGVPSQGPEPCRGWDTEADRAWERLLMASVKLTAKQVKGSPGGRFRESGPMEPGSEVKGQDGVMKRVARKPA